MSRCRAWAVVLLAARAAAQADECSPGQPGNLACIAGNECFDADPAVNGNWVCRCAAPYTGAAVMMGPTVCMLEECDVMCPTCENGACGGAQDCADPDPGWMSTNDWTCSCRAPQSGTGNQAAAACVLNECDVPANSGTCTMAVPAQNCVDPDTSVARLDNWECQCAAPSAGTAQRAAAACVLDECAATGCPSCAGATCTGANQDCADPDQSPRVLYDWICTCQLPRTGSKEHEAAACDIDECEVADPGVCPGCEFDQCSMNGQLCVDLDRAEAALGDWECRCIAPETGAAAQAVATCRLDECAASSAASLLCAANLQACNDRDTLASSRNDWECACLAPRRGANLGGVAACDIEECVETCGSCADTGSGNLCATVVPAQTCSDPDASDRSLSDWTCTCPAPTTGAARATVSPCSLDECTVAQGPLCVSCAGAACTGNGQTCDDPRPTEFSLSDWTCTCVPPTVGEARAMPAACRINECTGACVTCAGTACHDAKQTCRDPDDSAMATGDWLCECAAPLVGSLQGAPATCRVDECTATCASCENSVCTDAGQSCDEPSDLATSLSDWICVCPPPATGQATARVSRCDYDECALPPAQCPTCAGTTCTAAGQTCVDVDADFASRGDWECRCVAPGAGVEVGGVATCDLDECTSTDVLCGTCSMGTCTAAMQSCDDPGPTTATLGDWVCTCPAPGTGDATAAAATCILDECTETRVACVSCNHGWCERYLQTCNDPDTSAAVLSDWTCTCVAPALGEGTAGPADCRLDECVIMGCPTCADGLCASEGQTCDDLDTHVDKLGDWECTCAPPGVGLARAALADCVLDECEDTCGTCEDDLCSDNRQTCVDPVVFANATADWRCTCVFPAAGSAVGAVHDCFLNECDQDCATCVHTVCAVKAQDCVDVDTSWMSLSDWLCVCRAPLEGNRTAAAASCTIDECVEACPSCAGTTCEAAAQTCTDPDTAELAYHDWVCTCRAPFTGQEIGRAVRCVLDECANECGACAVVNGTADTVCSIEAQACDDPIPYDDAMGDWLCTCPPPAHGRGVAGAADCVLDECVERCATCANATCADAWQACDDPARGADNLSDWACLCPPPLNGSAVGGVAECYLDECVDGGCPTCAKGECHQHRQTCVDETPSSLALADWYCVCPPPSVGRRLVGFMPLCVLDECATSCNTCAVNCDGPVNGTDVNVPNATAGTESSSGSGSSSESSSSESSSGSSTSSGSESSSSGSESSSSSESTATDTASLAMTSAAASTSAATFTSSGSGCAMVNFCRTAEQACVDPNTHEESRRDWECRCAPPAEGAVTAGRARCRLDECDVSAASCTTCAHGVCEAHHQICEDPHPYNDTYDDSTAGTGLADWVCRCRPPSVGDAVAGPAPCDLDECDSTLVGCPSCAFDTCTVYNQTCVDNHRAWDSTGDWECVCDGAQHGPAVARAADCVLDECTAACPTCANDTCTSKTLGCIDNYASSLSLEDWYCTCVPPLTHTPHGSAQACELNECTNADPLCATCAGTACTDNTTFEQGCDDADTSPDAVNDWVCVCPAPYNGTAVGAAALCTFDECSTTCLGPLCAKDTCKGVPGRPEQTCWDPDVSAASLGDWWCNCSAPGVGAKPMAYAECVLDECTAACPSCENDACAAAGQTCFDTDTLPWWLGTWTCSCPPDAAGAPATAAPAVCLIKECEDNCTTCAFDTCTDANQTCRDPDDDARSTGDWECACVAPSVGTGTARAAVCGVDECNPRTPRCPTCEGGYCAGYGQICLDADPALNTWTCLCVEPFYGLPGARQPANCSIDECASYCTGCENGACTTALLTDGTLIPIDARNQSCIDVNTSAASRGDWVCQCPPPFHGNQTAGGAYCLIDECGAAAGCDTCENGECAKRNQTCRDPVQNAWAMNNWECVCAPPAQGHAVGRLAEPRECKLPQTNAPMERSNSTPASGGLVDFNQTRRPKLTGAPQTGVPRTPPPPTNAPVVVLPRPGDVHGPTAVGTMMAAFTSPSAAPVGMQLALMTTACHQKGFGYPWVMAPLPIDVAGSPAASMIVGNAIILAVVTALAAAFSTALRSAPVDTKALWMSADFPGLLNIPSAPLLMLNWFALPFVTGAASLFMYPVSDGLIALGILVFAAAAGSGAAAGHLAWRGVPSEAGYVTDPDRLTGRPVQLFLAGPGEWCSAALPPAHGHPFLWRWAAVLRPFLPATVWFWWVEWGTAVGVGLAAAVQPHTWDECGHVKLAQAVAFLMVFFTLLVGRPYARARDNWFRAGTALLLVASCATSAVGFYTYTPEAAGLWETAAALLHVAAWLLIAKVLIDLVAEVWIIATKRRVKLQRAQYDDLGWLDLMHPAGGGRAAELQPVTEAGADDAARSPTRSTEPQSPDPRLNTLSLSLSTRTSAPPPPPQHPADGGAAAPPPVPLWKRERAAASPRRALAASVRGMNASVTSRPDLAAEASGVVEPFASLSEAARALPRLQRPDRPLRAPTPLRSVPASARAHPFRVTMHPPVETLS